MDALAAARLRSFADAEVDAWHGAVTSEVTAGLRDRLYALLWAPGSTSVRLDVRDVTSIDAAGVAVLVGARHRAEALGRAFVLVDAGGPVTQALQRLHLLPSFLVTQVVSATDSTTVVLP
jgi:anti-anti-sigma regulatory factor